MKIIVDAMGGDNAPLEIVKGALAGQKHWGVDIALTGDENAIRDALAQCGQGELPQGVEIVPTSQTVDMCDDPATVFRRKKDTSMGVGLTMLLEGKADALVSAGSTGALLTGATLITKRIHGIRRAAMAPVIPTTTGQAVLIDCGANVDAKPSNLVQFARMGAIYMEHILGRKNPRVAIVNIGIEEEKGNALVKQTYPLLKECGDINFIGSIEARDIPNGYADVIVCEAFVGNVILKMYEGVAGALMGMVKETMMSSLKTKIGALLIKNELKQTLKDFDASDYGGAPMLGLKGLVVKSHGSSNAKEFKQSILQCIAFKQQNISGRIAASITADKGLLSASENKTEE